LKLTATDLKNLNIIDGVISEPLGGAHRDYDQSTYNLQSQIVDSLDRLTKMKTEDLIDQRIEKYSVMGAWTE